MVRLTHHELLQPRPAEPLRPGHPTDEELDELAPRIIKRVRGYRDTRDGIQPGDPALERLRAQLRSEREVARYLMVPYQPTIDDHGGRRSRRGCSRFHLRSQHGVPVEVICRRRRVDPKGRAHMPELLIPTEWPRQADLAIVFAVWIEDGSPPYLAGWAWEDEARSGPGVIIGSRVFHRRTVGQLHAMQRLVVASPYVPVKQISLEHAR